MFRLLVTDLDDTLYSWIGFFIPSFFGMVDVVSTMTGIETETLLDEYKAVHQEKGTVEYPFSTVLLPSVQTVYAGKSRDEMKAILKPAFDRFNEIRNEKLTLYPGVESVLETLKGEGVKIIGFTDSGEMNGFYRLLMLGISHLFNKVYVTNYEYAIPDYIVKDHRVHEVPEGKPNPELLERIIKEEGIAKEEVLYMGDSLTKDIYMAKKAGVKCVQCKYPDFPDMADYSKKLFRISSWTDDVFAREKALRETCLREEIKADYYLTNYMQLLDIMHS